MLKFRQFILREETSVPHDLTFMRANPFHIGHESVVKQVTDSAANNGGGHTVLLSRSQDPKKNPLTPEQKLHWAKKSFPGANIQLATPDSPTLLHHLSKLHGDGVTDVNLHVGSDRVPEFKQLASAYNGVQGRHGYYNFKSINVHPVGETRDDEATSGIAGASATAMRNAAQAGDRDRFHAMAPSNLNTTEKDQLMAQVHAGMNPPPEEKTAKPKKSK